MAAAPQEIDCVRPAWHGFLSNFSEYKWNNALASDDQRIGDCFLRHLPSTIESIQRFLRARSKCPCGSQ